MFYILHLYIAPIYCTFYILHLDNVVESQGRDIKNHSNETSLVDGLHSAKLFRRILQGGGETVIWPPGTGGGGLLMEVCLPEFSDQNGAKIIPFGVVHTYMA